MSYSPCTLIRLTGLNMKLVLGVLAFTAAGLAVADAATLNLSGVFNHAMTTGCYYSCGGGGSGGTVPEPATWCLMILGFALLARQVRAMRKAKA